MSTHLLLTRFCPLATVRALIGWMRPREVASRRGTTHGNGGRSPDMAHVAHKLGIGSVLGACSLLAGCQNTSGSRFASNQGPVQPVMAKQKQAPQPNWPTSPSTGTSTGFSTVTGPKSPGLNTSTA